MYRIVITHEIPDTGRMPSCNAAYHVIHADWQNETLKHPAPAFPGSSYLQKHQHCRQYALQSRYRHRFQNGPEKQKTAGLYLKLYSISSDFASEMFNKWGAFCTLFVVLYKFTIKYQVNLPYHSSILLIHLFRPWFHYLRNHYRGYIFIFRHFSGGILLRFHPLRFNTF